MNLELAKKVRELIRLHPEQHNQEVWSTDYDSNPLRDCGTSACIAGWVVAAEGLTPRQVEEMGLTVPDFAADKLQMDEEEADGLFFEFYNDDALECFDNMIAAEEARRVGTA